MKTKPETKQKVVKKYYTVKVEATAPILLTYRVLAEDAEQALDMVVKNPFQNISATPVPTLTKMRRLKGIVYEAGTSIIELVRGLS